MASYQVPNFQIDLPSIFAAAAQVKRQQEDIKASEAQRKRFAEEQARQVELRKAYSLYQQGTPTPLQQQFPEQYMEAEKGRLDLLKTQEDITQQQQAGLVRTQENEASRLMQEADFMRFASATVQKNPAAYPGLRQAAVARGFRPLPETPEALPQMLQEAETALATAPGRKYHQAELNAALWLKERDPAVAQLKYGPRYQAKVEEELKAMQEGRGTKIYTGEIGQGAKDKLALEIAEDEQLLSNLENVRPLVMKAKDYLGPEGKWKGMKLQAMQYIPFTNDMTAEDKQFLADQRELIENVDTGFLAEKNKNFGSAGPQQEMEQAKDTFFNTSIHPEVLPIAYERFMAKIRRNIAIRKQIIAVGVSPTSAQGRTMFNEKWKAARANEKVGEATDFMNAEVQKPGVTKEMAVQRAVSQGLLSKEQAQFFLNELSKKAAPAAAPLAPAVP